MVSPRRVLLLGCAVALFLPGPAADKPEETLDDERLVRLFVAGRPVEELIELIRASAVEFDLSDEMLDELRAAGLPESLLQAMQARQAEMDAPAPGTETPVVEAPPVPTLRLLLNPTAKARNQGKRPALRLLREIDPTVAASLGLREETPTISDLAIFLGCRTGDHVPDHWRSKTPLGRDFRFTPRHELLAFLPGARAVERSKKRRALIELEIPERIEVELEPDVAHDLTLGIAVQIADRYYLVASDERDNVILSAAMLEVRADLNGDPSLTSLTVHFKSEADPKPE